MAATQPAGDPFDALADPHRRAILEKLGQGEHHVQQLADDLPISRPAVSRHLRILKESGFVTDRADGTRRMYRLDDVGAQSVRDYLESTWGDAISRFTMFAENTAPGSSGETPASGDRDVQSHERGLDGQR